MKNKPTLPPRDADTMSDAIAMSSPCGHLRRYIETLRPYTSRPIGAPGSAARAEQNDKQAAYIAAMAIIDRLAASPPAEVSEEELARTLCRADGTGQCAAICLSHSSNSTSGGKCPEANRIWRHKASALLSQFIIGRR